MSTSAINQSPFAFEQLQNAIKAVSSPSEPELIKASDNVDLAVRVDQPTSSSAPITAALIFYHGGGAHAGAGCQLVARGLAEEYNAVVYTPDLRGHGASGGPRGDSSTSEQVFEDINTVIDFVKSKHHADAGLALFLGGHSSGGGVVVN